ncbi:MAG TPA: GNAT family N-acetyltransferase [Bacteroidales bacterium]|nr:peptidoglycan bridge formation glycyltransferase FemA/FemB family protein [Bacteroidales bacterium]HNR40726.1 GNAT family N-acetyltransferase [Bacteroidales bacterium]
MRVLINSEIHRSAWEDLLKTSNYVTPFQTLDFYRFYNSVPGSSAIAFGVERSDILLALAVVTLQKEKGIKAYFSRRAIIYGGPLMVEGEGEALGLLLETINGFLKNKTIYMETRNFCDYSFYKDLFAEYGWSYQPYLNYRVDCRSCETAWSRLNDNRRRQIKKALRNGTTVREASSLAEVRQFYRILHELYSRKIKKPLPEIGFFESFYSSSVGKYLLVFFNDKVIGGIMCPILPGKSIFEFYICGLDHEYREASPSVMATYSAIEYGCNNGLDYFDFMGAGKPDENYGVRKFKERFGGQLVEHGRFIKINNIFLYRLGKFSISLLSRLK